jgi:hypothetical protein
LRILEIFLLAGVVELADAPDSKLKKDNLRKLALGNGFS